MMAKMKEQDGRRFWLLSEASSDDEAALDDDKMSKQFARIPHFLAANSKSLHMQTLFFLQAFINVKNAGNAVGKRVYQNLVQRNSWPAIIAGAAAGSPSPAPS